MKSAIQFVASMCAAAAVIGIMPGAADAAKAKPPTVKQVNDQVGLVINDQRDAIKQYTMYELAQVLSICQGQVTHVTALQAMARPTRYPKATWKILQQGADAYAKGASECTAAAQRAIDTLGHENDTSGFKQVNLDWSAGNDLFSKASTALAKAKIH
jgi:hypothetical protein